MARITLFIYLLIKSHFFGLINTGLIVIARVPLNKVIDLVILMLVIYRLPYFYRCIVSNRSLNSFVLTISFALFYLVYSWLILGTTFVDTFTNFSDLWGWLFLAFLIAYRIEEKYLHYLIYIFCFVISLLFLFHSFMGFNFGTYQLEDTPGRLPLVFNFLMVYAFFISLNYLYDKSERRMLIPIFAKLTILMALYLSGFRSLTLAVLLGEGYRHFVRLPMAKNLKRVILSMGVVLGLGLYGSLVFQSFIEDEAIASRITVNEARINHFQDHWLFGLGYLGKESEIGQDIELASVSRFDSTIKVVDAGYFDLLLRFGVLGSVIYLFFLFKGFKYLDANSKVFLTMAIPVGITLSVFTFEFGIIALSLLVWNRINNSERTKVNNLESSSAPD